MLAKLARVDPELLSPIRHGSQQCQEHRLAITLRDSLVRQRVNIISTIRFSLKSFGLRLAGCSTQCFAKRCRHELEDSPFFSTVQASLKVLDELSKQLKEFDKEIAQIAAEHYPQTKLLQQIPGVGPLTSLSFVLTLGNAEDFRDSRDVAAYLGLVPRRDQSGLQDKQLPISKAGNRNLRCLLVQSAQYILGRHAPDCHLRQHGLRLIDKGGRAAKKKALIAVVRKLAVLMHVLWTKRQTYEPLRNLQPNT